MSISVQYDTKTHSESHKTESFIGLIIEISKFVSNIILKIIIYNIPNRINYLSTEF